MVLENIGNLYDFDILLRKISTLTTLFQAIGGLILAYIIFNIINTIMNRKKRNELRRIRQLLERMDRNISKIAKKK